MNDLTKDEMRLKVAQKLINGDSPMVIATECGLTVNQVLTVLGCGDFAAKLLDLFKNQARGLALSSLHNIARIAFDESPNASAATKLRASKLLVDIAKELDSIFAGDLDPATMTQAQLVNQLAAMQKEVANRAKPINTGQIDQGLSLNDMID